MFPNYWNTYDMAFPSLDCFDDVIPDLDLPKPEFESFVNSPVNGFNSIDCPLDEFSANSWLPTSYDQSSINAPLPPISTFFENTRQSSEENRSPVDPERFPILADIPFSPQIYYHESSFCSPITTTCEICGKLLPSEKSLKHHICMTHQIINKSCTYEFCSYVSKTRKEYNTHIRQHNLMSIHEKKRSALIKGDLVVNVNYIIRNQRELEVYLKKCSSDIIDTINQQQKELLVHRTNIPSMNLYIEYVLRDKKWTYKYTCIGCSKEFTRDYNAKRHSEKHSVRSVVCPLCERMVRGSMALRTHVTKYHRFSEES